VAKLKSIFGITDVFVEEATECTPEDITQLNLRARGKGPQKRLILAFNPISASHFLKRRFFDVPADNVSLHVMTYKDNAFLDPDDVEVLEEMRERDPDSYQVYALAQWGTHSSVLVFTNFEIRDFAYGADDLEDVGQGVDFGFNHASCVERSGMKDGELYVFDEFYQKGITNPELIEDVKAFDPGYERNRYVGDSAEPARIEEFLKAGFRKMTACRKGAGSVKAGIDHLKSMRIYVHRTRCPQLARTIAEFKYRLDRQGNLTDEFQSIDDDPIDALRYSRDGDALRVRGLSGKRRAEMAARRRVA
jgi:phage terminase large subunit